MKLESACFQPLILKRDFLVSKICFFQMCHNLFRYFLGKCLRRRKPILEVAKLGVTVVGTFGALWAPFALADGAGVDGLLAVLGRLAPFQRGIYEDYVANFWCATAPSTA